MKDNQLDQEFWERYQELSLEDKQKLLRYMEQLQDLEQDISVYQECKKARLQ